MWLQVENLNFNFNSIDHLAECLDWIQSVEDKISITETYQIDGEKQEKIQRANILSYKVTNRTLL